MSFRSTFAAYDKLKIIIRSAQIVTLCIAKMCVSYESNIVTKNIRTVLTDIHRFHICVPTSSFGGITLVLTFMSSVLVIHWYWIDPWDIILKQFILNFLIINR